MRGFIIGFSYVLLMLPVLFILFHYLGTSDNQLESRIVIIITGGSILFFTILSNILLGSYEGKPIKEGQCKSGLGVK